VQRAVIGHPFPEGVHLVRQIADLSSSVMQHLLMLRECCGQRPWFQQQVITNRMLPAQTGSELRDAATATRLRRTVIGTTIFDWVVPWSYRAACSQISGFVDVSLPVAKARSMPSLNGVATAVMYTG